MLVTAMEPRRKSMVEIYLDGQSAGQVDYETSVRLRVRPGDEMTDDEWTTLCAESDIARAKSYAFWLLERRSYTSGMLREKMRTAHSPAAIDAAIVRAQELGLVDDADYAHRYAAELIRLRHFSTMRIVQELRHRGIDRDLAQQAAADAAAEYAPDPAKAIDALLRTKFSGKYGDEKGRRRTVAALQRMGYRWDDIRAALQRSETPDWDDEETKGFD